MDPSIDPLQTQPSPQPTVGIRDTLFFVTTNPILLGREERVCVKATETSCSFGVPLWILSFYIGVSELVFTIISHRFLSLFLFLFWYNLFYNRMVSYILWDDTHFYNHFGPVTFRSNKVYLYVKDMKNGFPLYKVLSVRFRNQGKDSLFCNFWNHFIVHSLNFLISNRWGFSPLS